MKCEICGRGMEDNVSLHRVNEKGVTGIWRCPTHLTHEQEADIDPIVRDIINIMEKDNWEKEQ